MNFLAHFYLSNEDPDWMTGNFFGDMMRKAEWSQLPPAIKQGVLIHFEIDKFTDSHPLVKELKSTLLKEQQHFSGVVSDIFFDYFLAKYWSIYHTTPLPEFTKQVYSAIETNSEYFNKKASMTFHYMKKNNWLERYQTIEGIDRILKGMSKRTTYTSNMATASIVLQKNEQVIKNVFDEFFEELTQHIKQHVLYQPKY
ncbi:acyl carrier protein phosphodiesterase [Cyclobacteriaceae bacterium]|nr:acyl carrier protein phosphodiesterase [Cyclobacteriaceae bacterium]